MIRLGLIVVSTMLSACASGAALHNMPDSPWPNKPGDYQNYEVWVDADATFFPDDWENLCGGHVQGANSLFDRALSADFPGCTTELLSEARRNTLQALAERFRNSELVTIQIHGFNHGVSSGERQENELCRTDPETGQDIIVNPFPIDSIRRDYFDRRCAINNIMNIHQYHPEGHGYIDFFWNGLLAHENSRLLGSAAAWNYASINGERAGHMALQPILETLQEAGVQRVHLLTHSRGAAVALSALSGGKYVNESARRRNSTLSGPAIPRPLRLEGMEIAVTSTAPAIGRWHFKGGAAARVRADQPPRPIPASVSSYFATVNPEDFALKKEFGGFFVWRFNSTQFGHDLITAESVAAEMNQSRTDTGGEPFMQVEAVNMVSDQSGNCRPASNSHNATDYLNLRQVRERLREVYARP